MSRNNNQLQHSFGSSSSLSSFSGSINDSMSTSFDPNNTYTSKAGLPSMDSAKEFSTEHGAASSTRTSFTDLQLLSVGSSLAERQQQSQIRRRVADKLDSLNFGWILPHRSNELSFWEVFRKTLSLQLALQKGIDPSTDAFIHGLCKNLICIVIGRAAVGLEAHGLESLQQKSAFRLLPKDAETMKSFIPSAIAETKYRTQLSVMSSIVERLQSFNSNRTTALGTTAHIVATAGDSWIKPEASLKLISELGNKRVREALFEAASLFVQVGKGGTSSAEALVLAIETVTGLPPSKEDVDFGKAVLKALVSQIEDLKAELASLNINDDPASVSPSTSTSIPSSPSSPSASEVSLASADAQLQPEEMGRDEGNFGMSTRPTVTIRDMKTPPFPSYTLVGPTSQKVIPKPKTVGSSSSSRTISQAPSTSRLLSREYTMSSVHYRNPQFGSKNQRYGSLPNSLPNYVSLPTRIVFSGPRDIKIPRKELKLDGWTMEDDGKLWEDEDGNSMSSKESSGDESSEEASVDDDEEESRVGTSKDGNDGRKDTSLSSEKSDEIQLGNNTSNSKRASSSSTPPPASPKVRQPRVVNENFPVTPKRSNTFISASSPLGPIQSKSVTPNPKPKTPSGDGEASAQNKASTPIKKIGATLEVIKNRLSPKAASVREKLNGGHSRERTESQSSDLSEDYMALEDFKSVAGPNKPSSQRQNTPFSPARKLMGFSGSSIRSSQTPAASQASLQDARVAEDKIAAAKILLQLLQDFEAHKKKLDYSEAALALLQLSGRLQFDEKKIKNIEQGLQAAEALLMLSQQSLKGSDVEVFEVDEAVMEAAESLLALCRGC